MNPILMEHIEEAKKVMRSRHPKQIIDSWPMDEYIAKLIMLASAVANKDFSLKERYDAAKDYLSKNNYTSVLRYLDSKEPEILGQISESSKEPTEIKDAIRSVLDDLGLKADIVDLGGDTPKVACSCMKCKNEREKAKAEGRENPTLVNGNDVLLLPNNNNNSNGFFQKRSPFTSNSKSSPTVECEVYFMPAVGQQPLFSVFKKGELPETMKSEFGQYLFNLTVTNSENEIKSIPDKLKAIFQMGVDLNTIKKNKGW